MQIILMRHGQAEDETRPDSARQLTDYGQQQAVQTAEYITSHYKRRPDFFFGALSAEKSEPVVVERGEECFPAVSPRSHWPVFSATKSLNDRGHLNTDSKLSDRYLRIV